MLGTVVNTAAIIIGSIIGSLIGRGIKEQYKQTIYTGLGLASLAIGLNATLQNLPRSQYPVLFIIAIAIGGVIGTALDIDGRFHRLIDRTKSTGTNDTNDTLGQQVCSAPKQSIIPNSSPHLADGLSTAILLYCIGPLSMLGPVISALKGDNTFLYTNATLDLVSSTVFAATYGFGMVLAAPVLFCWQGLFWLAARLSSDAVGDALMSELLIVGGLLITASGLALLQLKDCKTLNLLPALLVPVAWFLIKCLLQ